MIRYYFSLLAIPACTLLFIALSGCSRSPHATFYTLVPTPLSQKATPLTIAPTIAIASVTLPELVDRPQLVIRTESPRVDILELHRWAEPLKSSIPRLIAANLSLATGIKTIFAYPDNSSLDTDYRLHIDIQRFEASHDDVFIEALWTLRNTRNEGMRSTGSSLIREKTTDSTYDAVIQAYSRALSQLSKDIAAHIRTATEPAQ